MSYLLALLVSLWSAPQAPAASDAPTPAAAHALVPTPAPTATDSLRSDAEIRLVVLRHAADVRRCYESEGLRRDPTLNGFLDVIVTIQPTGMVTDVVVATDSLSGSGAREVGRCVAVAARHWRFDRGPFTVETIVLPFIMTPESAARRRVIGAEM
jgi:hypothetical protein